MLSSNQKPQPHSTTRGRGQGGYGYPTSFQHRPVLAEDVQGYTISKESKAVAGEVPRDGTWEAASFPRQRTGSLEVERSRAAESAATAATHVAAVHRAAAAAAAAAAAVVKQAEAEADAVAVAVAVAAAEAEEFAEAEADAAAKAATIVQGYTTRTQSGAAAAVASRAVPPANSNWRRARVPAAGRGSSPRDPSWASNSSTAPQGSK